VDDAAKRHCEPTGRRKAPPDDRLREAIQLSAEKMDCFVAEFIIGPAEGRTRWLLATTDTEVQDAARRASSSSRASNDFAESVGSRVASVTTGSERASFLP
jgi:hypothetical protein